MRSFARQPKHRLTDHLAVTTAANDTTTERDD